MDQADGQTQPEPILSSHVQTKPRQGIQWAPPVSMESTTSIPPATIPRQRTDTSQNRSKREVPARSLAMDR